MPDTIHPRKKSSDRLATIAGSLLTIDAEQLRHRANGKSTVGVLVDEIQALAASVLSQVESMQDEGDLHA
jgi:hypothetical protein